MEIELTLAAKAILLYLFFSIPKKAVRTIEYSRSNCPLWFSGDPIPPEILPYVTKPFWMTKSTGHGLGLTIVR
jgi:signal transduction histidine kinase